jgi:hypothetical protein
MHFLNDKDIDEIFIIQFNVYNHFNCFTVYIETK